MKPRVLHLTRDLPPASKGGLSTAVHGLIHATRDALDHVVVSFDAFRPARGPEPTQLPPASATEDGVPVLRVTGVWQTDEARAWAIARASDLIVLHEGLLCQLAGELRALAGAPVVYVPHVLHRVVNALRDLDERTTSLIGQQGAFDLADAVIAPSEAALRKVLALYPRVEGRASACALGVVVPDVVPDRAAPDVARPRILYVGRYDGAVKGLDPMLEGAPIVLDAVPGATFEIVGGIPGNPRGERRWRKRFQERAAPETQAATRFSGWLTGDDLEAAYARATLLVVPSRAETFGLVALEGMVRGVPTVTTDLGVLEGVEPRGIVGLPATSDALADGILDALDGGTQTSPADVAARYGWPARAADWVAALTRVIGAETAS